MEFFVVEKIQNISFVNLHKINIKYLVIFSCFLTACATGLTKPGYDKIENPSIRFQTNCASVLPPQQEGWYVNKNFKTGKEEEYYCKPIVFYKEKKETYETYVASIFTFFDLPEYKSDQEFLEINTKTMEDDARQGSRFVVMETKHDIYKEENKFCTRHKLLVKDYSAHKKYRKGDYMILEEMRFFCKYPFKANEAIGISYSHRYNPGYKDQDFEKDAINFFNQVVFIE